MTKITHGREFDFRRDPYSTTGKTLDGLQLQRHVGVTILECSFRRGVPSVGLRIACPTSGGTHEQICDPAFDTGPVRDGAGGGPRWLLRQTLRRVAASTSRSIR